MKKIFKKHSIKFIIYLITFISSYATISNLNHANATINFLNDTSSNFNDDASLNKSSFKICNSTVRNNDQNKIEPQKIDLLNNSYNNAIPINKNTPLFPENSFILDKNKNDTVNNFTIPPNTNHSNITALNEHNLYFNNNNIIQNNNNNDIQNVEHSTKSYKNPSAKVKNIKKENVVSKYNLSNLVEFLNKQKQETFFNSNDSTITSNSNKNRTPFEKIKFSKANLIKNPSVTFYNIKNKIEKNNNIKSIIIILFNAFLKYEIKYNILHEIIKYDLMNPTLKNVIDNNDNLKNIKVHPLHIISLFEKYTKALTKAAIKKINELKNNPKNQPDCENELKQPDCEDKLLIQHKLTYFILKPTQNLNYFSIISEICAQTEIDSIKNILTTIINRFSTIIKDYVTTSSLITIKNVSSNDLLCMQRLTQQLINLILKHIENIKKINKNDIDTSQITSIVKTFTDKLKIKNGTVNFNMKYANSDIQTFNNFCYCYNYCENFKPDYNENIINLDEDEEESKNKEIKTNDQNSVKPANHLNIFENMDENILLNFIEDKKLATTNFFVCDEKFAKEIERINKLLGENAIIENKNENIINLNEETNKNIIKINLEEDDEENKNIIKSNKKTNKNIIKINLEEDDEENENIINSNKKK